jgi:SAM-dependent methyltransferase
LDAHTGDSGTLHLRDASGNVVVGDGRRWLAPVTGADERLLDRMIPPVLDVGCGPARHVLALSQRNVSAVGIEVTPFAVDLARRRGARVMAGSIFEPLPGEGIWATALLLDGNIGIGGDPHALLERLSAVVRPGGRILVELCDPGTAIATDRVRMASGTSAGPWFEWTTVGVDTLDQVAANLGLHVAATWFDEGRWFGQLDTRQTG